MENNDNIKNLNLSEDTSPSSSGLDEQLCDAEGDAVEELSGGGAGGVQIQSSEESKGEQPGIEHRILIIHDKDQDGYCAANIIRQHKKQPAVAVGMVPVGHSTNLRNVVVDPDKWDEVFIVDLVPPVTWINDLLLNGFKVTVIDHHETTRTNVDQMDPVSPNDFVLVYSDTLSASGAAWQHLYGPAVPMPWVVKMVNDWDMWDHNDPQVIPFHYGMECLDLSDWKIWQKLLKGDPQSCAQIMQMGQLVGSFWVNSQNELTTENGFTKTIDGIKFMVCNGWFTSSYDFAAAMQKDESCDAVMWFRYAPTQGNYPWRISMRTTKEEVNLLPTAEKFRGGGHKTSCGCNLTHEELTNLLFVKTEVETN